MTLAGDLLLVAGALLLVVAAWGVITLPDALARQHAATKAGTLALALVGVGAALRMPEGEWLWRRAPSPGLPAAAPPVAPHPLARAALREAGLEEAIRDAPRVGDQQDRR